MAAAKGFVNGVMMQYFFWDLPDDGQLWNQLKTHAPELAAAGVTAVWVPPPYKGWAGTKDVGYGGTPDWLFQNRWGTRECSAPSFAEKRC